MGARSLESQFVPFTAAHFIADESSARRELSLRAYRTPASPTTLLFLAPAPVTGRRAADMASISRWLLLIDFADASRHYGYAHARRFHARQSIEKASAHFALEGARRHLSRAPA